MATCWVLQYNLAHTSSCHSTSFGFALMTSNLYSTLLVERNSFFIPLYIGVGVPCLPTLTLAMHKIHMFVCIAQHCNVPLGSKATNLQHGWCMSHTMLCNIQKLLYACPFGPSIWVRNRVIDFVGSLWVTIITRWQVELLFGGSKHLWAFQGTNLGVHILCPRERLDGFCLVALDLYTW